MIPSIRNSLSGVKAGARALGASASNVANARNTAALDKVAIVGVSASRATGGYDEAPHDPLYEPLRAETAAAEEGGVQTRLRRVEPPHIEAFEPGDPNADEHGRVARTNVDLAEEIVRSRQARTLYDANLKALRAEDEMLGALLDDRA